MKRTIVVVFLFFAACAHPETPEAAQPAAPPPIGDAARGRQLAASYGCNACHVVPGVEGAQGSLAPSLAGVASRAKIANEVVVNTPENLAKYLENPAAMNPDSTMPALGMTTAEAKDIAAFLLTLR